ncbi:unnamed protein product [Kuraishia capsulata CBS 1993]|uniref:Squalene monooxygenase n=1 Tax=Kuraishia capsulata CBS 1993 TaxID=1382522 RepID=W6MFV7_9ASCO|nr:uncharacterized protein KUCA_T00000796001 [Kuraishia capsulata CBS 1993]CDK24829.1 unnamed protein product [Kuraishia capsulata CBS 1993]
MADYDVIVIGAGVVGPCLATIMARQGRKVLIVERDWSMPNRIVGELLQPGGLNALKEMGMIGAISHIGAIPVKGYCVSNYGQKVDIPYPSKDRQPRLTPVPGCVFGGNDKFQSDESLDFEEWDQDDCVRGVSFHHGDFLQNLREICKREPNVTWKQCNVVSLIKEGEAVKGINALTDDKTKVSYTALQTFCCDGIYSKFRKTLSEKNVPKIESYFVGLTLKDAVLPKSQHGNVILGNHAPVLIYQISEHDSRVLCAYPSAKLPPRQQVQEYLSTNVLPDLPECVKPSFKEALEQEYRSMPNQFLTAKPNTVPGVIFVGDALNMRHPLTGGGMTVGLNDAALLGKFLSPVEIPDLSDSQAVLEQLSKFHKERKNLDSVINVLSIALYSLFAADSSALNILKNGCFRYFERGGECVTGPVSLLAGMTPKPFVLFNHFFSVALYGIMINFRKRGWAGVHLAIVECFVTLYTAVVVFTPYLAGELFS